MKFTNIAHCGECDLGQRILMPHSNRYSKMDL